MLKSAIFTSLTAIVVTGCSGISPAGLIAAYRLDPLETSPSDISVAISVPDALRLHDGDASLYLAFVPDDPSTAAPITTTVLLSVSENATGPRQSAVGETIYVLGFSTQAAAQLSATQDKIKVLKEQKVKGTGTLSVNITGGCLSRALGDSFPISTWLRTDPKASFVPLTHNSDLLDAISPENLSQLKSKFVQC
jgi:hypothetical protein